jgi:hypothetical protein
MRLKSRSRLYVGCKYRWMTEQVCEKLASESSIDKKPIVIMMWTSTFVDDLEQ